MDAGAPDGRHGNFHDRAPARRKFRNDVWRGLARRQKAIPAKYFYDARGAGLFERICDLDEYYLTRAETAILQENAADVAASLPAGAVIVELGSGAGRKIEILLAALAEPGAYVPVDLSREQLLAAAATIRDRYPGIDVIPVCADFVAGFRLPSALPAGPRVGFFPGSTIGNLDPPAAVRFLGGLARELTEGSFLVIGVDLKKDAAVLRRAYDDAAGVTAAFNLNLLVRINRELDGTFDLGGFVHRADYNARAGRIEMHLESCREQEAAVAGRTFRFRPGETIHTENSYKYHVAEFRDLAGRAGLVPVKTWSDSGEMFAVHLLRVPRTTG